MEVFMLKSVSTKLCTTVIVCAKRLRDKKVT